MVGTCRKRTISAPELVTSRHERWEQKLAKEIRKQQKIFYHLHIYVKNVGPCNFWGLFPCSLTYLMFPCSLRFFGLFPCSHCQISRFPLFPKNPWGTLLKGDESYKYSNGPVRVKDETVLRADLVTSTSGKPKRRIFSFFTSLSTAEAHVF